VLGRRPEVQPVFTLQCAHDVFSAWRAHIRHLGEVLKARSTEGFSNQTRILRVRTRTETKRNPAGQPCDQLTEQLGLSGIAQVFAHHRAAHTCPVCIGSRAQAQGEFLKDIRQGAEPSGLLRALFNHGKLVCSQGRNAFEGHRLVHSCPALERVVRPGYGAAGHAQIICTRLSVT
jgi:hypothetical protein